jgi:hypothetical protein
MGRRSRIGGGKGERMKWARILAYITGTVDQELLLRNEYLIAENRILKAQLQGTPEAVERGAGQAQRDWPSAGAQGPRRCGDNRPAGYYLGVVSKARRSQIRWITGTSSPGQTADR